MKHDITFTTDDGKDAEINIGSYSHRLWTGTMSMCVRFDRLKLEGHAFHPVHKGETVGTVYAKDRATACEAVGAFRSISEASDL